MNLARTIRFDESDALVFHNAADSGEWAVSGGFEFSNWGEGDLVGKARQAFSNGWLGLDSFGRATFVATARIDAAEFEALALKLARHFVDIYNAPSLDAALPVAREELGHMAELCEGHDPNTLLAVSRELTEAGVAEAFRVIESPDAGLDIIAVHGTLDP